MSAAYYRHRDTGRVINVPEGSYLETMIAASQAYEAVDADAAGAPVPPAPTQTDGPDGAIPGVPSSPPAGPVPLDDVARVLAAAYEVDTVEGVNGYLDEHPAAGELVFEHERAHKARVGILEGRHAGIVETADGVEHVGTVPASSALEPAELVEEPVVDEPVVEQPAPVVDETVVDDSPARHAAPPAPAGPTE